MEIKRGMHLVGNTPSKLFIELVSGCNRRCDFCGMHNKGVPHMMSNEVFSRIEKQMDERTKFVCLSGGQGEATLHKRLNEYVIRVKRNRPWITLSHVTNGDVYLKGKKSLLELFDLINNGLNQIQLDLYDEEAKQAYAELLEKEKGYASKHGIEIRDYYASEENPWSGYRPNVKRLYIVDETEGFLHGGDDRKTRCFHTMAGNVPHNVWEEYGDISLANMPMLKTCKELHKHMSIFSNGDVGHCCRDAVRSNPVGNVMENTLAEIWNGEKINRSRYLLDRGIRAAIPNCYLCNYMSFRDGLYPYQGPEYDVKESAELLASEARITGQFKVNIKEAHRLHGIRNIFLSKRVEDLE
jgi:radical SAM protein with 4Fe4S-binding SPASM domain